MTLLEFLHPIRTNGRKEQVLGVLYYFKHFQDTSVLSVGEIREGLKKARVPQAKTINISHALHEATPYADRVDPAAYGPSLTAARRSCVSSRCP